MWKLLPLLLPLLLSACKTELYSNLSETDADQMMALLIYRHIAADRVSTKDGVTLRVDEADFVDAVEVLRQNGLPRHKSVEMQDLFPSGQLVSSPEQEAAKLTYLKGQQLEKMFSSMDGVITALVSVAVPPVNDDAGASAPTASVFIKYSPSTNFPMREPEIRSLVQDAIPGLTADHISISLQRAEYLYQAPDHRSGYSDRMPWLLAGALALLGLGLGALGVGLWRKKPGNANAQRSADL